MIYFSCVCAVALLFSHIALRSSSQDLIGFQLLKLKLLSVSIWISRCANLFSPFVVVLLLILQRQRSVIVPQNWSINHQKMRQRKKKRRAFSDHILRLHPKHGSQINNAPVGKQQIWAPELLCQHSPIRGILFGKQQRERDRTEGKACCPFPFFFFPADITSLQRLLESSAQIDRWRWKDAQKPISGTLIFIWALVLTAEVQRRRWMDEFSLSLYCISAERAALHRSNYLCSFCVRHGSPR